ncbi:FecR family protein [Larkinella sp. C7]|jgi:transmembrane sensor|uniref:FecR family protein n=1 Tax=Larkinella sp. C7 TaxID=2576607 RepID=UPI0011110903|nr:FecR domain-containing protein [Larkinella sp. C7]
MNPMITKELMFAHFAGKTTPLQKRLIEQWLHDETNQESFYQWLVEWERLAPPYVPELDQALERYVQHMQAHPSVATVSSVETLRETGRSFRFPIRWLAAAAVLIGLVFAGWLGRNRIYYQTYRTDFGQTRSLTLSDGSKVTLNANSELQVPRFGFGAETREVVLFGEAFFSVTHQAGHQKFLVKTQGDFNVTVLGTEFTVYSRTRGGKVMLRRGKVELSYTENRQRRQVTLKPGDLATFSRQSQLQLRSQVEPEKYTAFTEKRFVFEDMSLREFGDMITENYGLQVEISSDQLARRTLVGSFRADNVDDLLNTISEVFGIRVVRHDDTVRFVEDH